jgi:hypothetical protein
MRGSNSGAIRCRFLLNGPAEGVSWHTVTAMVSISAMLADAAGNISAWRDSDLIAALLILVLGVALGIGVTCFLLVLNFLRKNRTVNRPPMRRRELVPRERRVPVPLFQLPGRWLAVRSTNPMLVQAALGLHNPIPCSWEEGLAVANEQRLFISPPLNGWILVMGSNLPDPCDDVDKCFRFLMDLSRKLGQVQFFSLNRPVNHHSWAQLDQGAVVRAYSWAGRTLWNQGKITRAELELGLKCYGYGEGEERIDFGRPDPAAINTERLPLLAARWSLDPTSIDARLLKENSGIAGKISRLKA